MSNPIGLFIQQVRQRQEEIAVSNMKRPSADPMTHGVEAGKWQGLQEALDMLESIILDNAED